MIKRKWRGAPWLLDLFCCGGGGAVGYRQAGFRVVGVDIKRQPHYPFEFHQGDALAFLADQTFMERFEAVHASPPCQAHTRAALLAEHQGKTRSTIDLVEPTRRLLRRTGLPYAMENVEGAPLHGVTLCGSSFGLKVRRHRIFESNVYIPALKCDHKGQGKPVGIYGVMGDTVQGLDKKGSGKWVIGGSTAKDIEQAQEAMGIDWLPWQQLKEAIPPVYTAHVGASLMEAVLDNRGFAPSRMIKVEVSR